MGKLNKTFKERRKYVRFKTQVQVKYTIIGKPGTVKVSSKDVGAGGVCLVVAERLALDTPLQLEINIPDLMEPIRALGRVVWQKDIQSPDYKIKGYFDTGIEFTGISDFDRFNINRYVMDHVEQKA